MPPKRRKAKRAQNKGIEKAGLPPEPKSFSGDVHWKYLFLIAPFIPFLLELFHPRYTFQIILCAWAAICAGTFSFLVFRAEKELFSVQPGNILMFQVIAFALAITSFGIMYYWLWQITPAGFVIDSSFGNSNVISFIYFAFQLIPGVGDSHIVPSGSFVKGLIVLQEYVTLVAIIKTFPLTVIDHFIEHRSAGSLDPLAPNAPEIGLSSVTEGLPYVHRLILESGMHTEGQGNYGVKWSIWFLAPIILSALSLMIPGGYSRISGWGIFVALLFACGLCVFLMDSYRQVMRFRFNSFDQFYFQIILWVALGLLFSGLHRWLSMLEPSLYTLVGSNVGVYDFILLGFPTVVPAGVAQIKVAGTASRLIQIFEGVVGIWFIIGVVGPLLCSQGERLQKWRKYQRLAFNLMGKASK